MKRTLLATLLALSVGQAVRADTSATAPKPPVSRDAVLGGLLYLAGTAADADDKSPVKAETTVWQGSGEKNATVGLKDYQGSVTLLRGALSYGLLRGAGLDVVPLQKPESAFRVANLFAMGDAPNLARLEEAFKDFTGMPLVKKRTTKGDRVALQYNAAGLEAAFEKLYIKPSALIGTMRAGVVYDTLFKTFVRREAEATAALLGHKGFLAAESKRFVARSLDGKDEITTYQYELASKLGGPLTDEPRLIGTLLRRHADGTLPTVIKILRTVLRDYDPDELRRLDSQLKAPVS
jgi:hypothetical protein